MNDETDDDAPWDRQSDSIGFPAGLAFIVTALAVLAFVAYVELGLWRA